MPNELIYNILTGILYIGIPFLVLVILLVAYNSITSIKDGISTSMTELSMQIVQRNNEVPKLLEEIKTIPLQLDKNISEVIRTRQNIKRAVELRDSERISKAEAAFQQQMDAIVSIAQRHPSEKTPEIIQRINSMNENINELTSQYNFKVQYFNDSISSVPLVLFAKTLNIKRMDEISYG